jgi:hypothetical protein
MTPSGNISNLKLDTGLALGAMLGAGYQPPPPLTRGIAAAADTGDTFGQVLQQARATAGELAQKRKQAEEGAAGLVSAALILPILKQVRRSPLTQNNVFSGGEGEKAFGPEFDMQIADRIAHSPRLGIRDALTNRLMQRGAVKKTIPNTQIPSLPQTGALDTHG